MAAPVDSARQGTNITTAATSHAVNVGSPAAGTLLIVFAFFPSSPGTCGFTGYSNFAGSGSSSQWWWRWADGTEGATDTFTTTNSIKASFICWEITGAANEAPTAAFTNGFTTTANIVDPPSGAPTSPPQDTLYIAAGGGNGELQSYTGAPTNYASLVTANSGSGGAATTNCFGGGASRQISASSSDNPGVFTHGGHATVWTSWTIAIRAPSPKSTSVAHVSLGSYGEPGSRTAHSIKIRARTTSGSTGVIKAALYEGSTNRSGDLTSSALTNTLANYTLSISDSAAATITNYSDLEIRFWGYDAAGNALVFEVADIYLEVPEASGPQTYYGITSLPVTFSRVVSGSRKTFSQIVAPFAFSRVVSGSRKTFSQIAAPFTFVKSVIGITSKKTSVAEISLASHGTPSERTNHSIKIRARTTSGSTGVIRAALYEGSTNRSGDLSSSVLTNSLADYTLTIPDASAANITDYSNLSIRFWGFDGAGNALVFEVSNVYLELPAVGTIYGATSATFTFGKSVVGVSSKKTTVAEISLASHGVPTERTNHRIKIRARTISGSTGVIKAALYEGSTNRSGDLSSLVLTNSLADYTLEIPDLLAENITDYSNLSIRFWGFDGAGNSLVFEVANIYLELPVAGAATYFGVIDRPFTFIKDVSASRRTFSATITAITFTKSVLAQRRTTSQIVAPFTFTKSVSGARKTFSQIVAPFMFVKDVAARRTAFGQVVRPFTFVKDVAARRTTFSATITAITFTKSVLGQRRTTSQIVAPFTFVKSVSGKLGTFGQIVRPFTFTKSVVASKQTFAQVVRPFTFVKDVSARRTAFGQVVRPFTFVKDVAARRTTFGQIVSPFVFGKAVGGISIFINRISATFTLNRTISGTRRTFSQIVAPFTFVKIVSARKQTFGQIVRPFTFVKDVSGQLRTFGQVVRPFTFVKSVSATKQTFGQIVRPFTFFKDVTARKQTFGQTATSLVVSITTVGNRSITTFYGVVSAPFTFVKSVAGQRTALGQTVSSFVFSRVVSGSRKTFSQIVAPFTFVKNVAGQRTALGQIVALFTFSRVVAGSRKTFSQVVAPFTFSKAVSGIRIVLGQTVSSFTFNRVVSGSRKTFGQVVRPFTFIKDVTARKQTFGQIVRPFTFVKAVSGVRRTVSQISASFILNRAVAGRKQTFARVDLPLIFTNQTNGRKQTFGRIELPINIEFYAIAEVQGVRFGKVSMDLIFGESVFGTRKTFGQIDRPYLFVRSTQAVRRTFSRIDFPFTLTRQTSGRRRTFGSSVFPINASIIVAATTSTNVYGQVALSLVFGEQTSGRRKTFGRIAAPYIFDAELNALLEAFGSVDFPIDFVVDVKTGRVETHSSLGLELLIGLETAGMIRPHDIILNLAKAIYLWSTPVDAVYVDSQKVWSK